MSEPGCIRCGQCCTCAYVWQGGIKFSEDTKEFARWLTYHRCDIQRVKGDNPDDDTLMIRIPLVCKHLTYQEGQAVCKIYDKRPIICREYKCNRLK